MYDNDYIKWKNQQINYSSQPLVKNLVGTGLDIAENVLIPFGSVANTVGGIGKGIVSQFNPTDEYGVKKSDWLTGLEGMFDVSGVASDAIAKSDVNSLKALIPGWYAYDQNKEKKSNRDSMLAANKKEEQDNRTLQKRYGNNMMRKGGRPNGNAYLDNGEVVLSPYMPEMVDGGYAEVIDDGAYAVKGGKQGTDMLEANVPQGAKVLSDDLGFAKMFKKKAKEKEEIEGKIKREMSKMKKYGNTSMMQEGYKLNIDNYNKKLQDIDMELEMIANAQPDYPEQQGYCGGGKIKKPMKNGKRSLEGGTSWFDAGTTPKWSDALTNLDTQPTSSFNFSNYFADFNDSMPEIKDYGWSGRNSATTFGDGKIDSSKLNATTNYLNNMDKEPKESFWENFKRTGKNDPNFYPWLANLGYGMGTMASALLTPNSTLPKDEIPEIGDQKEIMPLSSNADFYTRQFNPARMVGAGYSPDVTRAMIGSGLTEYSRAKIEEDRINKMIEGQNREAKMETAFKNRMIHGQNRDYERQRQMYSDMSKANQFAQIGQSAGTILSSVPAIYGMLYNT